MNRYETVNKRPQLKIGEKFGALTVISDPYYIVPKGEGHRRQYFDFKCDCGKTKERIQGARLKRGHGVLLFCDRDCPLYLASLPDTVPEENKKCKLGEKYNYLTIIREAFYHQPKGHTNRYKCVEVKCKCGKTKIYREDKVFNGSYKSCGCVWEYQGRVRDWKQLKRNYGLSKDDYYQMLDNQDGKCAICKREDSGTVTSEYLFVDHCHTTGKVRGLLCDKCNRGLGYFKDDIDIMKRAINYLS